MDGRTAARAFSNDGLFFLEKFLVFLGKEWIAFTSSCAIASMPCMKFSGLAFPFAISVSVFSHSAVSFGEVRLSGRTQTRLIPFFVGKSCLPLRSTKPEFTSFSMTAARVAGVPNPLRSASAFVSSLPACSMADKRLASVWGFDGCVS